MTGVTAAIVAQLIQVSAASACQRLQGQGVRVERIETKANHHLFGSRATLLTHSSALAFVPALA